MFANKLSLNMKKSAKMATKEKATKAHNKALWTKSSECVSKAHLQFSEVTFKHLK